MKTISCVLEPPVMVLLQVCGYAPLHRFAPAPQLQSVSRRHAESLSYFFKLPPLLCHLHLNQTIQLKTAVQSKECTCDYVPA